MSDLIERLQRMSKCVYLATEESVADDIADGLKQAAARIAELEASVLKITADCNAVVCGKSDRITELEAEVARLRVDGERYRWLRKLGDMTAEQLDALDIKTPTSAEDFDRIVDAAKETA